MSIASQITRLQNIKTAIRNALVSKGITGASSHDMADFAEDIGDIQVGGNYQSKTAVTGCIVVFNPNCYTESMSFDWVDIYYKNTSNSYNFIRRGGTFGSSNWSNVVVPVSDEIYVYWKSDSSQNYWGYKIDNILPYTGSSFTTPTTSNVSLPSLTPTSKTLSDLPESSHPYTSNESALFKVSLNGLTGSLSPDSGYDAMSSVTIPAGITPAHSYPVLQTKTVTPTTSVQTVKPDSGYVGLSQVTVNASSGGNTQTKSYSDLTAGNSVTLTPDSGYVGLSSVTVSAASLASQTSGTATANEILQGYTAWVNGRRLNGSAIAGASPLQMRVGGSGSDKSIGRLIQPSDFSSIYIVELSGSATIRIQTSSTNNTYTIVNNNTYDITDAILVIITTSSGGYVTFTMNA